MLFLLFFPPTIELQIFSILASTDVMNAKITICYQQVYFL